MGGARPAGSVEFIHAIEHHFDLILRSAQETLIPVEREFELCRAFLKIMSFRKLVDYELTTSGFPPGATIPPLLFHTLVENGATHHQGREGRGGFEFSATRTGDRISYRFASPPSTATTPESTCESRGVGVTNLKG